MKTQVQRRVRYRFPDFRCFSCLAGSLLLSFCLYGTDAGEQARPGERLDTGRRKIIFEDTREVYRKPALEVLGQKTLPTLKSGFLFVDGHYLSPPYRLSRKGNLIFVNSRRIAKYAWPPSWTCVIEKKPEIPKAILTKAKEWGDLILEKNTVIQLGLDYDVWRFNSYYDLITSWYVFYYLPRTAFTKLAHEISSYPFVRKAEVLTMPSVGMRVYYADGSVRNAFAASPCYDPVFHIPGHRTIVKKMDAQLDSLRQELAAGSIVFWDGSRRFFGGPEDVLYIGQATERIPFSVLRHKLPKVIEIIQEDAPLKKRAWAFVVLRFVRSEEAARAFIDAFTTDAGFRRRLESLRGHREQHR